MSSSIAQNIEALCQEQGIDRDLVIEAAPEIESLKVDIFQKLDKIVKPEAIFASNTSTIPISRIAQAAARPDRVVGMHFFSPVHKMPLLEVIVTEQTDPQVTATVVAYGKKLGKTVIVVNDGPGFYANRIEIMKMAKIGSRSTYHRLIKELSEWEYIEYLPTQNPTQKTMVRMSHICTDSSTKTGLTGTLMQRYCPKNVPITL